MGTITIGLKKKPTGQAVTFEWGVKGKTDAFIAVRLKDATIETVKDFCENYTDANDRVNELKTYKEMGCKYVLSTRHFNYGCTRAEARKKALQNK